MRIIFIMLVVWLYSFSSEDLLFVEDVVTEESDNNKDTSSKYFQKIFSGSIEASKFKGDTSANGSYNIIFRYQDSFLNFVKIKLETRIQKLEFATTLKDRDTKRYFILEPINNFSLRDGYVDLNIFDFASIVVGKKVISWGQLDLFSPIDAVLPSRTIGSIGTTSRIDNRLSQQLAFFAFHPVESFDLQAYYFPKITRDEITNKIIDTFYIPIKQPKNDNEYQFAFRTLYYGDIVTVGLTYYNGWEKYFTNYIEIEPNNKTTKRHPKVQNIQAFGAEISIPIDKITFGLEAATIKYNRDLVINNVSLDDSLSSDVIDKKLELFDWSINKNDSKLYIPIRQSLIAIGADYYSDNWILNITGSYNYIKYNNDDDKKAVLLGQDIEKRDRDTLYGYLINMARKFGLNRDYKLGVATGNIQGWATYVSGTAYEALNWSLSYVSTQDSYNTIFEGKKILGSKGFKIDLKYNF